MKAMQMGNQIYLRTVLVNIIMVLTGLLIESSYGYETQLTDEDFQAGDSLTVTVTSEEIETGIQSLSENTFEGDMRGTNVDYIKSVVDNYAEDGAAENDEAGSESDVFHGVAIRDPKFLWPNGQVPYTIDSDLSSSTRAKIAAAVSRYRAATCIRWVPRSGQTNYVHFFPGNGCYSDVGVSGNGKQMISIGDGCEHIGTIIHEMMHAVGFFHEQSRPDRNDYINVLWTNIEPAAFGNFKSYGLWKTQLLNTSYDFGSIMHYSSHAFSRNGNPTIVRKQGSGSFGQRRDFSETDIRELNRLYKCSSTGGGTTESPETGSEEKIKFYIENKCNKDIQVAVNYMTTDDEWVTDGWWHFVPDEKALIVKSNNRHFYIHAKTQDGGYFWKGTDLTSCVCSTQGPWSSCSGNGCNKVGFFQRDVGPNPTKYTQRLTCPDAATSSARLTADFYVRNKCDRRINVAVHYMNTNDEWVTDGWWILDPGEKSLILKSDNRNVYVHAKSLDKKKSWGSEFSHCVCSTSGPWSSCNGNGCRNEKFFHVDTGPTFSDHTQNLVCN